jgi:hypothetical protein
MNWRGTELKALTDDELREAIRDVVGIDKNRLDKLDQSRKRHKAIFDAHPPVESLTFTNLAIALNAEFQLRGLENL